MPYADLTKRREMAKMYSRRWALKYPERVRARAREFARVKRAADPEEWRHKGRLSWHTRSDMAKKRANETRRRWSLKRLYDLTVEEFDALLEYQNHSCAICHKDDWGPRGPVVDHDHTFNFVRGILCHKCNLGLGHFNDSADLLESAAAYIRESR